MMKVTLEMNTNDLREFEKALGSNDDEFDLLDSIFYAIDYAAPNEENYHNGIKITLEGVN